jgi:acetyltransferase-like isoleucine patch superfamily enzyme
VLSRLTRRGRTGNVPESQLWGRRQRIRQAMEWPLLSGPASRVHVKPTARLGNVLINSMVGDVHIGEYCFFGHDSMLLTGGHEWRLKGEERMYSWRESGGDIFIEDGAWVASQAIILGPCRIGANSVVTSNCVIDFDVPPDTIVKLRQDFVCEPIKFRDLSVATARGVRYHR